MADTDQRDRSLKQESVDRQFVFAVLCAGRFIKKHLARMLEQHTRKSYS